MSLVNKFAGKYSIEARQLLGILKATAFKVPKNTPEVTNEQMAALLVVADQFGLNPFTKEIYAFPDKKNGIVPVVGVDGWSRIINDHDQSDGFEFNESEDIVEDKDKKHKPCPAWIECVIYRKDRSKPIKVREYFDEVYRPPFKGTDYETSGPWQSHTKRMLRHKALIQAARLAYGFTGIYDEDEAQRIIEHDVTPTSTTPSEPPKKGVAGLRAALAQPEEPAMQIPTVVAFNTLLSDMEKAQSSEVAELLLDQARELPEDQQKQLREVYDTKFSTTE